MTIEERAQSYARTFPTRPPMQVVSEGEGKERRDVLYGQWVIGADYRNKTKYYGAYPAGYLDRVMALFPDVVAATSECLPTPDVEWPILHAFAGSLPPGNYSRISLKYADRVVQDVTGNVYNAAELFRVDNVAPPHSPLTGYRRGFQLVIADPPYTAEDAKKYGTPMINRGSVFRALAKVTMVGGHVVWLDTVWPMHRKDQWRTVGRIAVVRSTNHRIRMASIFERISDKVRRG